MFNFNFINISNKYKLIIRLFYKINNKYNNNKML